jgi:hypothetical protein
VRSRIKFTKPGTSMEQVYAVQVMVCDDPLPALRDASLY